VFVSFFELTNGCSNRVTI